MMWKTAATFDYSLLKEFARENRNNMTEAEAVLWSFLRTGSLGVKFLRQHIIGENIVDFLCRKNHLVIEVDGGYHAERQQQEDDAVRSEWLEERGYKVIRFSNEAVLFDTETVIGTI